MDKSAGTKRVAHFYDEHPYPPPVQELERYRQRWAQPQRRRADFYLHWPSRPYREDLDILIAGCGTSQAAKHALRQPAARVVGIDVSATSIERTNELKRRYNLDNLVLHQLPMEQVHELGLRFDKIVCTGVLHHLIDPDAGLRALRDVLQPDGVMNLMVYATYGRTGVYMLQEYCRRLGIGTSSKLSVDDEILDLANTLMSIPDEHPLAPLLGTVPDFRSRAGLADALLHPQDRAYTVPELFEFIHAAGLTFGRWVHQAPYLATCGSPSQTPHAERLAKLPPEEQYAAIELLRGTMVRHNVIAYPAGAPDVIQFDGQQWMAYVPLRHPDTVLVTDRNPPGAAGVLINQDHTNVDLALPIRAAEKRIYDAIDGRRTFGEIMKRFSSQRTLDRKAAHGFCEKLWYHDLIVVDASSNAWGARKL